MILNVTKKNGRKVRFQPEKFNRWANEVAGSNVDWSSLALNALNKVSDCCTTSDLVSALIKSAIDLETEEGFYVAGKIFISDLYKTAFGSIKNIPTLYEHYLNLQSQNLLKKLDYTEDEFNFLNSKINYKKDLELTYSEVKQFYDKYLLKDFSTGIIKETIQFLYMTLAMTTCENKPKDKRLDLVVERYELLSNKIINLPSPNLSYIRTPVLTGASCCLSISGDTVDSIAANNHIAFIMTAQAAGIGNTLLTRSEGASVRNGMIKHTGKIPLYRQLEGSVRAMVQGTRGGALTTYIPCLDPEVMTLISLRNPKSVNELRVDKIDYALTYCDLFARKVANSEDWMLIDYSIAPDLYTLFYSSDTVAFEECFNKYFNDSSVSKTILPARQLALKFLAEAYETGRFYDLNITEANRHTPFKDVIYSSNLCTEILEPTKPYAHISELYREDDDVSGEVALCNLGAIVLGNVSDDNYEQACYHILDIIDWVIDNTNYKLPHVGYTAKKRRNAGVGITNLAYYLASKNIFYSSKAAKIHCHFLAERHSYYLHKASLRLSKEYGKADWIHKTKYPDGWLPIDTANKKLDSLYEFSYHFDWESLRKEIIENGGIRHSVLETFMPVESSSIATNSTNGLYPIREGILVKTDGAKMKEFIAPGWSDLQYIYELATDIPEKDLIEIYAVFQKFCGQTISVDTYYSYDSDGAKRSLSESQLLKNFIYRWSLGLKSKYYLNSKTNSSTSQNNCAGGACTL